MSGPVARDTEKIHEKIFWIDLSEDEMTAFARVDAFDLLPTEMLSHFKQALASRQVLKGLIPDNIKKLLTDRDPKQRLLIAKGKPPQPGTEAELHELVNFTQRPDFDIEKLKVPTLAALKHENLVFNGRPLIRIVQPQQAIDGCTVTGKPVPPIKQVSMEAPEITLGSHTAYSPDDPNLIIATADGMATFIDNTVSVSPCLIIQEDCDIKLGPIDCDTSVIIFGDAKVGTEIDAAGNVEVYGTVEDVHIRSGQDVIIHGGFVGHGKGLVRAERHVLMAFALFQHVEAGDTVFFLKELIGCKVFAKRKIMGKTGCIIGGKCEALLKIQVHFAGSEEAVITRLIVGRREYLMNQRREMDELVTEYQESIKQNKQIMFELVMKQLDNDISDHELQDLMALQMQKKALPNKVKEMEERLTSINKMVSDMEKASIEIRGIIHEKVQILIGDTQLQISEKNRRKIYQLVEDKITTKPIH